MKSRLLTRLDESLATASSPSLIIQSSTRRAIYLARKGEAFAANAQIDRLRAMGTGTGYGDCVAAANVAEGVTANYAGNSALALDKLRRGAVLCGMPEQTWLGRLSLAWQVHTYQFLWQPEPIPPLVRRLAPCAVYDEHDVISRLYSVMAVGLHAADRFDLAKPWYDGAHHHALKDGDELTIDANLHNVAAIRLNNISLNSIERPPSESEITRARWELNSSINYAKLIEVSAFSWSLPALNCRILLLEGNAAAAQIEYARWLDEFAVTVPTQHVAMCRIEHAYCLAKVGDHDRALQMANQCLSEPLPGAFDDDLAITFHKAAEVFAACNRPAEATNMRAQALDRLDRYRNTQRILQRSLADIHPFDSRPRSRSPDSN